MTKCVETKCNAVIVVRRVLALMVSVVLSGLIPLLLNSVFFDAPLLEKRLMYWCLLARVIDFFDFLFDLLEYKSLKSSRTNFISIVMLSLQEHGYSLVDPRLPKIFRHEELCTVEIWSCSARIPFTMLLNTKGLSL